MFGGNIQKKLRRPTVRWPVGNAEEKSEKQDKKVMGKVLLEQVWNLNGEKGLKFTLKGLCPFWRGRLCFSPLKVGQGCSFLTKYMLKGE